MWPSRPSSVCALSVFGCIIANFVNLCRLINIYFSFTLKFCIFIINFYILLNWYWFKNTCYVYIYIFLMCTCVSNMLDQRHSIFFSFFFLFFYYILFYIGIFGIFIDVLMLLVLLLYFYFIFFLIIDEFNIPRFYYFHVTLF